MCITIIKMIMMIVILELYRNIKSGWTNGCAIYYTFKYL